MPRANRRPSAAAQLQVQPKVPHEQPLGQQICACVTPGQHSALLPTQQSPLHGTLHTQVPVLSQALPSPHGVPAAAYPVHWPAPSQAPQVPHEAPAWLTTQLPEGNSHP